MQAAPQYQTIPDITVAQDGSGEFVSVQAAIDSVPKGNKERIVIFVRNGTYNEHIRMENSFITLRGEDRKATRITWEINDPRLRPDQHEDGIGLAVLNLYDCNDIVIENLTIENTASLGLKPFTVWSTGTGTRIVVQDADIIGHGGDTLSLWSHGMYYHRNLYVSGTYHFVGPRGTCYMRDSVLEVLSKVSNALFNEGMDDEREKFVLHRCRLVSKAQFGLGSWFRDGAWYFVDCQFPETLSPDGSIFLKSAADYIFRWPTDRIYFSGSKGPNYPWLSDNINKSPAGSAERISAAWTFYGKWDPENQMPPQVTSVTSEGAINVMFSESVTVKGSPGVVLADGKTAMYKSGSGTSTLTFAAPGMTMTAVKSFYMSKGAIMACRASASSRFVTETQLSK